MRKKDRQVDIFSLSFLDVICCGFGAVILLLVITKIYEPYTIEESKNDLDSLLLILQQELFEIRGNSIILNRDKDSLDSELASKMALVTAKRNELRKLRGEFAATEGEDDAEIEQKGDLLAARQDLSEEMEALLKDYQPDKDASIGGIPVDSEYIIFVIDTSGSMFNGPWPLVLQMISETLAVYPKIKGIQVLNDEGKYLLSTYAGRWIPDNPSNRRRILQQLSGWNAYSDSSPVEGITEAINTFHETGLKISIYVYGDDYPRGAVESVARYVDRVNQADREGNRLMRIHGVGFPTQLSQGASPNALRFANLMRTLCERNGGTFVALTTLGPARKMRFEIGI